MTPASEIRKIYQGVADRRQMFRMFDRHAQRPNRFEDDAGPLYRGEWFEVSKPDHDYMFNILPPLFMRDGMFAMREFLTDRITSVFYELNIDSSVRYFHAYCDLVERGSADRMRAAIIERESRPVRAMTRDERLEHIWSSTHDDYRGYAGERWPNQDRGKRTVLFYHGRHGTTLRLLDRLSDAEVVAKLPVHLRYLPDAIAA
ncbi:MAG: DUF1419 domain-containing protein [Pseudaminobacter sp.]|jgi:hypothetical protein|uniref:DUF1419 domain-containing protein n=1 Tax=Aquamicrobium defluvii TaxID=69279 RepID=A0A011SSF2_9HYPH|nr:DUF1419 domain-containing protein [Aquamicrobium defluvii]EXL02109.1 hypothetical protein BG36_16100 [Aquamicrobium defluvii]EZQ12911.1 hypothetical protein CF98_30620 [Halopseudomonas bauzanensis]